MQLALFLDVCGIGFFGGFKKTKVVLLALVLYFRPPLAARFMPTHPEKSRCTGRCGLALVLTVLSVVDHTQIRNAVVFPNSVDVIYLACWPFAVEYQPRQAVRLVRVPGNRDSHVPS